MITKFSFLAIVMILSVSALFTACSKNKPAAQRGVPVTVGTVVQKNVPVQLRAIGNVEAYNSVAVKPQVGGEIVSVFFKEGQDVKQGDLLFKIDSRPYEAALKQAEANLARDAAQAKNAEEEAGRYAILVEKNYVAKNQYDQLRANADALAAVVDADKALVESGRLNLAYCTIRSPIDGRAGSVLINVGNVVKANDVALVTINKITPIYVAFSIPEQNLAEIKKYTAMRELKVEVNIPGDEKRPAQGDLTFIDNAVDTSTGTIKLKGTFVNRDKRLWPGQFVDVVLTLTTERNRIVVPSQAVQTGQQGQYVYVIKDDMTAEFRLVTPLRTSDGWTIIDKGLSAGEKVVTDGQLRLVPGSKVELKNENPPAAETQREENSKSQIPKSK